MKIGRAWESQGTTAAGTARVYSDSGEFLGLVELTEGKWQPRLVLGGEE